VRCKKIRDDKGYWTQVDVYIRNHWKLNFHGICPNAQWNCILSYIPRTTNRNKHR
jgi:hypothetical protein